MLISLRDQDCNPGLLISISLMMGVLQNINRNIQRTSSTKEFIKDVSEISRLSKRTLIEEFNRCVKKHKASVKEQQKKFMFQLSLKIEFNEDFYDELNDVNLT